MQSRMMVKGSLSIFLSLFFFLIVGCGEGALFSGKSGNLGLTSESEKKSDPIIAESTGTADASATSGSTADNQEEESQSTDVSKREGGEPINHEIPGATSQESEVLNQCIRSFKNNPFGKKITNFRRIHAVIVIGGKGTPIDDTKKTDEPELLLIDAAINISSDATYNLMNPRGYYCMTLNMNIKTDLKINLHCSAQVSDSALKLQVKSTGTTSPSMIGIHVKSNVVVNDIRPTGDSCIR